MDGKRKVAAAVAVVAAVVLVASSAVRCAVVRVAGAGDEDAPPGAWHQVAHEEFAVEGLADEYVDMVGADAGAVREAVASYARVHVPGARGASFDGEVYADLRDGRVVATFHCDDEVRTILTVTYAAGAFTVAG